MIRIYCLKKIKREKRKSLFKKEYIQVGESQEVQKPIPHPDLSLVCICLGEHAWSPGGPSSINAFPSAVPMMAGTFLSSLSYSFFLQLVLFKLETSPEPHFVSGSFVPGLCCKFFPTGSPVHCPHPQTHRTFYCCHLASLPACIFGKLGVPRTVGVKLNIFC